MLQTFFFSFNSKFFLCISPGYYSGIACPPEVKIHITVSTSSVLFQPRIDYLHLVGPQGFEDLGSMAIYFQGAGEHWLLF